MEYLTTVRTSKSVELQFCMNKDGWTGLETKEKHGLFLMFQKNLITLEKLDIEVQ